MHPDAPQAGTVILELPDVEEADDAGTASTYLG